MIIPPYYIGAALLFWGLESDNILLGFLLAVILEASHLIKEKWTLSEQDFTRISDLTSVIFITAIGLILLNKPPLTFFRYTTIWLPVILLPLVLAQLYSTNEKIIIGTQIGSKKKKKSYRHAPMDFSFYYIILTLFAAGAANSRSQFYFPLIAILIGWMLFHNRGKSFKPWVFGATLLLVILTGYFGIIGVEKSHNYLRKKSWEMMRSYYLNKYSDPYKSNLAYGAAGKLKQSGKIIIRVHNTKNPPPLLKEASYINYNSAVWTSSHRPFTAATLTDETKWDLIAKPHPTTSQTIIEQNIPREKGLLARPVYSYRLVSPNLFELERSSPGTLRALDTAPVITTTFFHGVEKPLDDLPDQFNLVIPDREKKILNQTAGEIWKKKDSAQVKAGKLHRYFSDNFSYSLNLQNRTLHKTLLANFLTSTKKGHCELFATASALLLRTAGIPSRYVTGFAVEEYSELEKSYIVRERHAHAWCEAYVDGKWITVDNTPANWQNMDRKNRSFLEPMTDLFSYLKQQYKRFQIGSEQNYDTILSIVIVVLAMILIYRIYRRLQLRKNSDSKVVKHRSFTPPPSPFSELEQWLQETAGPRHQGEQFFSWLKRISAAKQLPSDEIVSLYTLHQKLRFDPDHFSQNDLEKLKNGVEQIVKSEPKLQL